MNDNELIELKAHIESKAIPLRATYARVALKLRGQEKCIGRSETLIKLAMLHIDIAGPFLSSDDGYSYFLFDALRLPGFPLLIDVRLLTSRMSVEVCDQLERMVAYLESLQFEGFPICETSRIKRLHSDQALRRAG